MENGEKQANANVSIAYTTILRFEDACLFAFIWIYL